MLIVYCFLSFLIGVTACLLVFNLIALKCDSIKDDDDELLLPASPRQRTSYTAHAIRNNGAGQGAVSN